MDIKHLLLAATLVALPASSLLAQGTTYNERHSIAQRQANQQARINHGVRDGQITPGGAAAAERTQNHIAREDERMRSRDGGRLTAADRHRLARQQNRASRNIYNRNHNAVADRGVVPNTPR